MISKVQDHHRERSAAIYIRQSTMGQVRHHQESTERQYAFKARAQELGWPAESVQILDADLGQSGTQTTHREDFKRLVTEVSMARVGAIFALEASRLARSNLDWQRLIEICAVTQTLVIDEDGCYDPADFNDGLLLGLKGTIAQAELHFIHARLQGGKLNKAKRGELRFPLPVGLSYGDDGQVELDADQEVQGAVRLVFRGFRETGTAYAVVQQFARQGLRFPKRAYGGAWDGKLIWDRLSHSRVLGILKNPSYAGVYVYGRYHSNKEVSRDGTVRTRTKPVPMDCWHVRIADHHPGYINWEEFERNQALLEKNRTNGEAMVLSGPAREGLALLQGLLLCSRCGRRLSVRYTGNGGIYPMYECNALRREGLSGSSCMSVRCDLLDGAVVKRALAVLEPTQIEVAAAAMLELDSRDDARVRQWQMRIERAEYEVQLAERRYEEVDPSNRLVAGTLEKRWNDALVGLKELREQLAASERQEALRVTAEQRAKVLALAEDFPRLWQEPSTKAKDKKRLLQLLIKDITVEQLAERQTIILHVRWQGGACEDLKVTRLPKVADQLRYAEELVQRVRELSCELIDDQVAETLNREGRRPSKGETFTKSIVRWIRHKHRIPAPRLMRPGELTVWQVAEKLGVSRGVVYYWIDYGVIEARRQNNGSPYWITLDAETTEELRSWVRRSARIQQQCQTDQSRVAGGAV